MISAPRRAPPHRNICFWTFQSTLVACAKFLPWPYISAFRSLPNVCLIQMNGQLAQGHTDTPRWVYHRSIGSQKGVKRMKKKGSSDRKGSRRKRGMQWMEEKREKEERKRDPPKWLWSCIKLVMSVIRGKSAAEACSIRGEMATLRPLLLFCHSSLIAPSHALLQKPVWHVSYAVHCRAQNLLTSTTTGVVCIGMLVFQRHLANF